MRRLNFESELIMKNYTTVIMALILSLSFWTCSTTKVGPGPEEPGTGQTGNEDVRVISEPQSLADFLVGIPGVYLDARYGVRVRGGGPPLFIIDGVPIGNSYESAASSVSVHDIESVEVLKSPGDLALYGQRGANGVIIINTKN
jgi:TonB-dependent SusC/RagA subfamily outer membrane receptor